MITYKSTRGNSQVYTFSEAVLKGIALDGGLLVPNKIPTFALHDLTTLMKSSYIKRAAFVLNLFQTDLSEVIIDAITKVAYGDTFDNSKIAPLIHLKENEYILELFHGPTWAFKDMALQIMPLFFSEAVKMENKKRKEKGEKPLQYLILVATSGDTGKAALEGYKDKENIHIMVFFPDKQVSSIQERSMVTQEGENVAVYPLYGNFDETQNIIKEVFNDAGFNKKILTDFSILLSAANSINWGRLLPQIIYHISSYVNLLEKKVISLGDQIDIAVPTGNFGNMFAAFIAKKMGLPVRKFICASNENNVLTEFLHTGIFNANKKMVNTPSPAMDILVPSNIERLLYFITNDSEKISHWMQKLKEEKLFKVDISTKKELQKLFYADWVSNEDCLKRINQTVKETNYLLDPHTAVVTEVVTRYKKENSKSIPIIICSTAHWAKFPESVYSALQGVFINTKSFPENEFDLLMKILGKLPTTYIPESLLTLKYKPIIHKKKAEAKKEIVEDIITTFLERKCFN